MKAKTILLFVASSWLTSALWTLGLLSNKATEAEQHAAELTACNQPCADVGGPGGVAGMEPVALVGEQCVCAVTVDLWADLEGLDAVEVDGE